MGGKSIHAIIQPPRNRHYFLPHESRYKLDICPDSEDIPVGSRVHQILHDEVDKDMPFTTRHFYCCTQPRRRVNEALNLDLLLTCRQVYKEAALLPFAVNNFTVEFGLGREPFFPPSANVLEALIGTLAPQQRRSIKHLTLASRDFNRGDGVQIERLRGLVSLQVIHTHFIGHVDAVEWPNEETFSWGKWSPGLEMPVLKSVRHFAELQPGCACPNGCWDFDQVDNIRRTLAEWEGKLLEYARNSQKKGKFVQGGEDNSDIDDDKLEDKARGNQWKIDDGFRSIRTVDDEGANSDDDEQEEEASDQWDLDDSPGGICAVDVGVGHLQRLANIRVRLPRDGSESRDLVWYVMAWDVTGWL